MHLINLQLTTTCSKITQQATKSATSLDGKPQAHLQLHNVTTAGATKCIGL
jgi:hypothetical protein